LMVNLDCTGDPSKVLCGAKPWAFSASLYPCIQTYGGVNISRSQLQQDVLSTTKLPLINVRGPYYSLAGDLPSLPGVDCSPAASLQGRKTQATRQLKSGKHYVIPPVGEVNPAINMSDAAIAVSQDMLWYDPACTYMFGVASTEAISSYLGSYFFGYNPENKKTLSTEYGQFDGRMTAISGDPWLESLYANGTANMTSVTTYMNGLANSITAAIRRNGDSTNSAPVVGKELGSQTCIQFEWPYLALDVFLLIGTVCFLSATLHRSRRIAGDRALDTGRGPWKSSSLPLLWCGLEDTTRRRHGTLD
jgi:hypothetical protein